METGIVAEGLQLKEGPIAMPDGSDILVEIKRQTLTRVTPGGRLKPIAEIPGGPNGAGRLAKVRWPRPGLPLNFSMRS